MQIVIDIPEEVYKHILSMQFYIPGLRSGKSLLEKILRAIRTGMPLPNHGDLIDVSRKITVSTYDEQYEEWGEETMTVLEALNRWSDEGVRLEDVIIPADKEGE